MYMYCIVAWVLIHSTFAALNMHYRKKNILSVIENAPAKILDSSAADFCVRRPIFCLKMTTFGRVCSTSAHIVICFFVTWKVDFWAFSHKKYLFCNLKSRFLSIFTQKNIFFESCAVDRCYANERIHAKPTSYEGFR